MRSMAGRFPEPVQSRKLAFNVRIADHSGVGTGPLVASREGGQPRLDLHDSSFRTQTGSDTAAVLENLPKVAPVEIP
jgi:hypothetical protein